MNVRHAGSGLGVLWPRGRWLVAVAAVGLVILCIVPGPFLLMYLGMATVGLAMYGELRGNGVTARPISFCLPGYRESLFKRHVVEGALHGLGFVLVLLASGWLFGRLFDWSGPGLPPLEHMVEWLRPMRLALAAVGVFFAGMMVHAAASGLSYSESRWLRGGAVFADGAVWLLLLNSTLWAFLYSPIIWLRLLPVWLLLGVLSWIRLRDMRYIGDGHRVFIQRQANRGVRAFRKGGTGPGLESLFMSLMRRHGRLNAGRYCWGEVYQNFVVAWSYRTGLVALAIYASMQCLIDVGLGGLALVLLGLFSLGVRLPLTPGAVLLVPAGRRERVLATGAVTVGTSVVLAILGMIAVAAWRIFSLLVRTLSEGYVDPGPLVGIDPAWFYWPCLLVPWVIASRLFRGWTSRAVQGGIVVAGALVWAGTYLYGTVPAWGIHVVCVCVWAAGWLLLLMALRARSRAGDLLTAKG